MAVGEGSYTVGKAFTQMKRHLSLGTQEIDPVLFVEPAVAKLKLPPQVSSALLLHHLHAAFVDNRC
jgi:hypothetical protein